MRFEKVRFDTFLKDLIKYVSYASTYPKDVIMDLYGSIKIPERSTAFSAGYDFCTPMRLFISGGQSCIVPSGIKCYFTEEEAKNWHLKLYPRSSVGINKHVLLTNGVGVIDADYYNNLENEGDIIIALTNMSEVPAEFKVGDKVMQGIFEAYAVTENDLASGNRTGGIGSTGS